MNQTNEQLLREIEIKEETRTLEEVCEDERFQINIAENTYCQLAMSRKISCKHQSDKLDHNELYPCLK